MSTNIELAKTRDFGEIISDTFLFVRENFIPLIKCFFIFCGFFLVATAVLSYTQQSQAYRLMDNVSTYQNSFGTSSNPFGVFSRFFGIEYLLLFLFAFLNWVTVNVTIISYMAVYKTKGNLPPTPAEVWGYIKYYFLKIAGAFFVTAILGALGFVCCIIPGIWLYPILGLIFPIMIVENTSFSYAFSQSFRIIKDNWWATFGALFVIGIVVYILTLVIVLPVSAANIATVFLHSTKGVRVSPGLLLISTVLTELCHVLYILPLITLTLCYFNLTEQKDSTGLMDRINQLGNNEASTDLPAEEY